MSRLVLIVGSEREHLSTLESALCQEGYATTAVLMREPIVGCLGDTVPAPALILLDLARSNSLGLDVCRIFRGEPGTQRIPIIVLSDQSDELDRVSSFEAGADDYVVKPFSQRELLLRVRVLIRRTQLQKSPLRVQVFAHLRVDIDAHRVWVGAFEISLTALEFRLLMALFERRGRVQTRERLLNDVWQLPGELATRTVDTNMKRLRQKLGHASDYIETIRGVGYRFLERPEDIVDRDVRHDYSRSPEARPR